MNSVGTAKESFIGGAIPMGVSAGSGVVSSTPANLELFLDIFSSWFFYYRIYLFRKDLKYFLAARGNITGTFVNGPVVHDGHTKLNEAFIVVGKITKVYT